MTKIEKTTRHRSICKTVRVKVLTCFGLGTLFIFLLNQENFSVNKLLLQASISTPTSAVVVPDDCLPDLKGTKVLALGCHLYGNLGDEMETTPFLKELKRCGVLTTGVTGIEMNSPKLHTSSVREQVLFDNIVTYKDNEFLNPDNYHAVIFAPGPWNVEFFERDAWKNRIDIFFGGSFMDRNVTRMGEIITKISKPSLVVTREKESMKKFEEATKPFDFDTKLMLSGDLSHSLEFSEATMEYWKRDWKRQNLVGKKLVFVRSNNQMNYKVLPEERKFQVEALDGENVTLDVDDVILATSAAVPEEGDIAYFDMIKVAWQGFFRPEQIQLLDNVEKMWALISSSDEVITDRCEFSFFLHDYLAILKIHSHIAFCNNQDHPAVSAHRLGKPFTVMRYDLESIKVTGAKEVAATTTTEEVRELNTKALRALQETLVMLKKKNHELVEDKSAQT